MHLSAERLLIRPTRALAMSHSLQLRICHIDCAVFPEQLFTCASRSKFTVAVFRVTVAQLGYRSLQGEYLHHKPVWLTMSDLWYDRLHKVHGCHIREDTRAIS